MRWFSCVFLLASLAVASASNQINIADDDADQGMYGGTSWDEGSGGDNGFFAWKFATKCEPAATGGGGFAGRCFVGKQDHEGLEAITAGRAFALFANGQGAEKSVAFRGIAAPLEPGDNFSVDILASALAKEGAAPRGAPGEAGVVYRAGGATGSVADLADGARLKFYARADKPNYLIDDSEKEFDTGIPAGKGPLSLTLTVVDADTYDLEVIGLRDHSRKLIERRKFGGPSGQPVNGLAFLAKDCEGGDFFFNNLRLNRNAP